VDDDVELFRGVRVRARRQPGLRQQAADQAGDLSALAEVLRLDRSTLYRVLSRDRLRYDTADRIAVCLGRHPSELWPEWFPTHEKRPMTAVPTERAPVLTVQEAADYLRISRGLACAAVRDGSLPSMRIGRRILIPRRQLEALLDGDPPTSGVGVPHGGEGETPNGREVT